MLGFFELYDGPLPEYEINESGIMVLCKACDRYFELLRNDGQHHGRSDQVADHDCFCSIGRGWFMEKQRHFISYCWKDGNTYADELETQLKDEFDVQRDKSQLIANDDIYDFMAKIAN